MIKAIIFDLDNTLLDFMNMKSSSINAAVLGMISAGMKINKKESIQEIYNIYDTKGYEHQEVLNEFIVNNIGNINFKYLAAGIVEYKKAKEESLNLYDDVIPTLNKLIDMNFLLIDRYLISSFLKKLLNILTIFVVIFLVVDVIDHIDKILDYSITLQYLPS